MQFRSSSHHQLIHVCSLLPPSPKDNRKLIVGLACAASQPQPPPPPPPRTFALSPSLKDGRKLIVVPVCAAPEQGVFRVAVGRDLYDAVFFRTDTRCAQLYGGEVPLLLSLTPSMLLHLDKFVELVVQQSGKDRNKLNLRYKGPTGFAVSINSDGDWHRAVESAPQGKLDMWV